MTTSRRSWSPWLLPEDGIIDEVAVEITAAGTRRVRLTETERRHAAARILAAGGSITTIAARLHVSHHRARALANQCERDQAGEVAA
jgi:hypothetical protein